MSTQLHCSMQRHGKKKNCCRNTLENTYSQSSISFLTIMAGKGAVPVVVHRGKVKIKRSTKTTPATALASNSYAHWNTFRFGNLF